MKKRIIMRTKNGEEYIVREGSVDKIRKLAKNIVIFASATVITISGVKLLTKDKEKMKTPEHFEMVDTSIEENTNIINSESENNKINIDNDNSNEEMNIEFSKLKVWQKAYDINYEEIRDFVNKYSGYANYTYEEALDVVYNGTINNERSMEKNPKTRMMYIIFDNAEKEGKVNSHCENWEIETRYSTFPNSYYDVDEMNSKLIQNSEIEKELISLCDDLGIEGEDKYLAIAIFRQETDYGASERCVKENNFGGIVFDNQFAVFSNPDYGMYKTLDVIKGFITTAKSEGCYDIDSKIVNIAPTYCTHTPDEWIDAIYPMYLNVVNDYNSNDKNLVR